MRLLRALLLFPLLLTSTLAARADGIDFKMNVQDPAGGGGIKSAPFTFTFGACYDPGEADGCFYGQNITGTAWTSMTFYVPDTGYIKDTDQTASCGTGGLFTQTTCPSGPQDGNFVLTFFGGAIPNYGLFLITEDGVPYADFPTVTVDVNTVTPEPNSLLLLTTGLLALGWLGSRRFVHRLR